MAIKNKSLNSDLLVREKRKVYELPSGVIDYSKFQTNNWRKDGIKNKVLDLVEVRGGALWMGHGGKLYFRNVKDGEVFEMPTQAQMSYSLSSFLNRAEMVRFFRGVGGSEPKKAEILPMDLMMVEDEFTPFSLSEFYLRDDRWYRTSFSPSKYLRREFDGDVDTPSTIFKLIENLTNNNPEYYIWLLNWVAGFFQSLKKSQVSLVLKGDQGSGKGIFFSKILAPLFGERYCQVIDSENIESSFKNWIEGRLFLNLNEIAVDMKARRNVKNFLKQLVTDDKVTVELKHKNANPVKIFANILITSNEAFPIEIEPNDRRFSVMQTGKGLKKQGWDMYETLLNIEAELPAFAKYLASYKVDWRMYDTALDTPEKEAIVDGTTSQVRKFIHAITSKDINFFESSMEQADDVDKVMMVAAIDNLKENFKKDCIGRETMLKVYNYCFDNKKTSRKLMSEMKSIAPDIFGDHKVVKNNNFYFFRL